MKKITSFFISAVTVFLVTVPSVANAQLKGATTRIQKKAPWERSVVCARVSSDDLPFFRNRMRVQPSVTPSHRLPTRVIEPSAKVQIKSSGKHNAQVVSETRLWGSVVAYESKINLPAFVSFSPSSPNSQELIWNCNVDFAYGLAFDGNYLRGIASENGSLVAYKLSVTDDGWEFEDYDYVYDYSICALETASAKDGTIFGQFLNADATGLEYGIADYDNMTHITIGVSENNLQMVAMGVTSDKRLFGIDTKGVLWQINTSTGKETRIGETGVMVSRDGNYGLRYYTQGGEIDWRDDTFYWVCTDPYSPAIANTTLYTVDLTTGKATALQSIGSGEEIANLLVQPQMRADSDPAVPTDLQAYVNGAEPTVHVSFKTPVSTYSGGTLTGKLFYEVQTCNEYSTYETVDGIAEPGENVSIDIEGEEGELNIVKVYVCKCDDSGEPIAEELSEPAKTYVWVGYDRPYGVTNVNASIDESTRKVTVTWQAPAGCEHNGYQAESFDYEVTRYLNGEYAGSFGVETSSFEEVLESSDDDITTVYYNITAYNGSTSSWNVASTPLLAIANHPFSIPFSPDFKNLWAAMKTFDLNGDSQKDEYGRVTGGWSYGNYACYTADPTGKNGANDWLILPAVVLEKGKTYEIEVMASGSNQYDPVERFEVKMGTEASVASMSQELIPVSETTTSYAGESFKKQGFTVSEDGQYYIGIHAMSSPQQYDPERAGLKRLYIRSLSVRDFNADVPKAVTNLTVVPEPTGMKTAVITFNAPTETFGGKALDDDEISKIVVQRDGYYSIATLENVKPGESVTVNDDNVLETGYNRYSVVAYKGENAGIVAEETAFIGMDVPMPVSQIFTMDNEKDVLVSWDKVGDVGIHGAYVNPDKVNYQAWIMTEFIGDLMPYKSLGEPSGKTAAVAELEEWEQTGPQGFKYFGVKSENETGTAGYAFAPFITGESYKLPLVYNFNDNDSLWYWDVDDPQARVEYDNMGGFFSDGTDVYLFSGKISLANAKHPVIAVDATGSSTANKVYLTITMADGKRETLAESMAPSGSRNVKIFDLTKYASQRYIQVCLAMDFTQIGSMQFNRVMIYDELERNLTLSGDIPAEVVAGGEAVMHFNVTNLGNDLASDYTINVYAGDRQIYTVTMDEGLMPAMTESFDVTYEPDVFTNGDVSIRAEVLYDGDVVEDDNVVSGVIKVNKPVNQTPSDVEASAEGNKIMVTWQAPDEEQLSFAVTEDFESYDSWATDNIGSWKLYMGLVSYDPGIFSQFGSYNGGKAYAYEITDAMSLYEDSRHQYVFPGHSGVKYLSAYFGVDETRSYYVPSDNWVISPILPGKEQTITFWVRNMNSADDNNRFVDMPNHFNVLYSLTDNERRSFKKIGDTHEAVVGVWHEVSVELPEGARYFAIENTENAGDGFWFSIDDISYIGGTGLPIGYKIYVDGELVGTVGGSVFDFDIEGMSDGTHTVSVSALYADGMESLPVAAEPVVVDQILRQILSDDKPFDVYSVDGKLLRSQTHSLYGLSGVYIINGKKVTIK
ncbi:MAG: choice-of-anchor J domain-containing protein [Prevotella sp.]|nr:choice-of-anchor J domain-containing protein [Prevotella sp.]